MSCSRRSATATHELAVDNGRCRSRTVHGVGRVPGVRTTARHDTVAAWWSRHTATILSDIIRFDTRGRADPGPLLSDLLARFRPRPLIDEYGVYEQLMQLLERTSMHDDVGAGSRRGLGRSRQASRCHASSARTRSNKTKYEDAHLTFGSRRERQALGHGPDPAGVHCRALYFAAEKAQLDELSRQARGRQRRPSRNTPRSTPSRRACLGRLE